MPSQPSFCGMFRDTIRPTRRVAIQAGGFALLSGTLCGVAAAGDRPRRILLRSSWQTVNIGDIAHTPGLLATLERELPEVEITLWPSSVAGGVEEMLRRRFPRLRIAADRAAVDTAFADCDLLLGLAVIRNARIVFKYVHKIFSAYSCREISHLSNHVSLLGKTFLV